jgi:hypothetical protein
MNVFVLALFSRSGGPNDTSGADLKFYRRQAACGKRKLLAIPSFSIGEDKDPRVERVRLGPL